VTQDVKTNFQMGRMRRSVNQLPEGSVIIGQIYPFSDKDYPVYFVRPAHPQPDHQWYRHVERRGDCIVANGSLWMLCPGSCLDWFKETP